MIGFNGCALSCCLALTLKLPTSRTFSFIIPSPSLSNALKAPGNRGNDTEKWHFMPAGRSAEQPQRQSGLTEHPLQPHEAADVTVEADVEALVCVAHGDDVVQLVVQVEPYDGNDIRSGFSETFRFCCTTRSFCAAASITCVVHCVPHVEAANVAVLTAGVAFEDQLSGQSWETSWSYKSRKACKTWTGVGRKHRRDPTSHALIFLHRCLNSCRFSFPVPSV